MIILGCMAGLLFLSHYLYDTLFRTSRFISSGPLSSNHANLQEDCHACHEPGNSVSDALCSSCHEKTSELTVYDFGAHYIYRSGQVARTTKEFRTTHAGKEMQCSACHIEHRGKNSSISKVSDKKCQPCHPYDSFQRDHPEFEFAREHVLDDSSLAMTHIRHTAFVLAQNQSNQAMQDVMKRLKAETIDMTHFFEQGCLYCHTPDSNGRSFVRIDFDRHCAACHVKNDAVVQSVPKFQPGRPDQPGVESIEQILQRGGPGTAWAAATNPGMTSVENGEVTKAPVWHRDPWILENLSQIRGKLFPGDGLYQLLDATGAVETVDGDSLYRRAIAVLRRHADELRTRPELGAEVEKINRWLETASKQLERPTSPRSTTGFALPGSTKVGSEQAAAWLGLANELTAATGPQCQRCHLVENAGIVRVQAHQETLTRAEFNHRAHILERRCTDCHDAIPISEALMMSATQNHSEFKQLFASAFKADRSATQNLPTIGGCRDCHATSRVASSCVTCHRFHPNKRHRSNLQLFLN